MGKLIDRVVREARRRLNDGYNWDRLCPVCPKPARIEGISTVLGTAPKQGTVGLAALHFLTEAVPKGVLPDPNRLLGLLVVKCEQCGNIRLFDATPELQEAIDDQT